MFDLSVRFPSRSPSKTYLDMSVASGFIKLFLIPARKKLAGVALRQAELRVTDQVLATVTHSKTDFYRENLTSYDDPEYLSHPPGKVAEQASENELLRDGA